MNKKIIANTFKILFVVVILYYPYKIAIHYLTDFRYYEISNYGWLGDNCGGDLLLNESYRIDNNGDFRLDGIPIGKVTITQKPDYFTGFDRYSGGRIEIKYISSGITCEFSSMDKL